MKNLSSKLMFIILSLNIIVTGIVAIPPGSGQLITEEKLLNLEKKTQEQQKVSQSAYPLQQPSPTNNGHWLIILGAIIVMAVSCLLEGFKERYKKS